ncbi:hypothetical protein SK128_008060 [Halocaridina rubra]|uniref:C2H2-type domain-containing protein n=1 Tax=Halocaridina rubra TaxID=373956 RepID=A0AAN8XDC7_HALRR
MQCTAQSAKVQTESYISKLSNSCTQAVFVSQEELRCGKEVNFDSENMKSEAEELEDNSVKIKPAPAKTEIKQINTEMSEVEDDPKQVKTEEEQFESQVSDDALITSSHKCVLCNQQLPSKEELQAHFRRHANQEIDIKGKPRVKYLRSKDKDQTATCKLSSKIESLNHPVKASDNAICDVCGEVFSSVSLAISHKFRKHPDSAIKYYCPHCGMMFPIKVNRDHHLKTHPPAIPKQVFPCLACKISFYSIRALKFHVDSAHKGSSRMISPIDTPAPSLKIVFNNAGEPCSIYYCHLCGCEYQIKYNLQRHLERKHSEHERTTVPDQIVQCNICRAPFYSKRAYDAHNHHHRSSDIYATDEFVRQTVIQRIDQDFDQRRVPSVIERYLSASAVSSNRAATWRSIRAAKSKEEKISSVSDTKALECKDLFLDIGSNSPAVSSDGNNKTEPMDASSDSDCALSTSVLDIDDQRGTHKFIRGENMCWGEQSTTGSKKRLPNDSEEDDCEMNSLGLVNPETVLANPRLMCDHSEPDLSTVSLGNDIIDEVLGQKEGHLTSSDEQNEENNDTLENMRYKADRLRDGNESQTSGFVKEGTDWHASSRRKKLRSKPYRK